MTNVLGIHIGHDGGAAICSGGELRVACAEERLTRRKYASGWLYAAKYCLEAADLRTKDIDLVVFSNAGEPLPRGFDGGLRRLAEFRASFDTADHHLSHAVGAFAFSGLSDAVAVVCDAGGNHDVTESVFVINEREVELIAASPTGRPRAGGLGTTYEAFTNYLGFADQESGKTMALAAYGEPPSDFPPLFHVKDGARVYGGLTSPHHWGVVEFASRHHLQFPTPFGDSRDPAVQSVAAYIQTETERALFDLVETAIRESGVRDVCLSGGVALNCTANSKLRSRLDASFFPFGAGSDSGLAIGNALVGYFRLTGVIPRVKEPDLRLGRRYSSAEIKRALERHPDTVPPGALRLGDLHWERLADPVATTAALLCQEQIVGWFQGSSESGPRALGARSILALPSTEGARDRLNVQVKHREWFRPFGPSILESDAAMIAPDGTSRAMQQMVEAVKVGPSDWLRECTHVDGTARLHTVPDSRRDRYAELLRLLRSSTGIAAVINTSFNVQEPIVETPGDAIATFLRSRMDALVLDDVLCITHRVI